MVPPWNLSWHHVQLGIADLWSRNITGKGVTVAVLDSGLARVSGLDHPEIEALDAEGNPASPYDPLGHGTCCASLIASRVGGALGIAPEVRLLAFRVLETGNDAEKVETALRFISQQADIDVVSCSFTIANANDGLRELVRALANAGKVVVAAAGDQAGDAADFPEQTQSALTIAAVDQQSLPLAGAQMGPWIDASAPGRDLPALAPGVNRVVLFSESSAAAAVASGVAALVLSTVPAGPDRARLGRGLEGLIKSTSTPVAGVSPDAVGAGVISPAALIRAASTLLT
jgi:subtilisin family serine protease